MHHKKLGKTRTFRSEVKFYIFWVHSYTLEDERLEPTNHPFRKENDLNQTSMIMVQPLIFQGVTLVDSNPFSQSAMAPMPGRFSKLLRWSKRVMGLFVEDSRCIASLCVCGMCINMNIYIYVYIYIEAGRPPECSCLLIYEIEISQVITSFHHHIL